MFHRADLHAVLVEAVGHVDLLLEGGQRLANAEVRKITEGADFRERLAAGGAQSQATSVEQFGAFIVEEMRKWASIVQSANVKAD